MKCFVIRGVYTIIYEGSIEQSKEGRGYNANIKNVYVYDKDRKLWEKWDSKGNAHNADVSRAFLAGTVATYPNAEIAEKKCLEQLTKR